MDINHCITCWKLDVKKVDECYAYTMKDSTPSWMSLWIFKQDVKIKIPENKRKKERLLKGLKWKEHHILLPMRHQIAPISHSALCLPTSYHNDPLDQPFVQIIQYVCTSAERVLIASEEAYYTTSLLHSTQKKSGEWRLRSNLKKVDHVYRFWDSRKVYQKVSVFFLFFNLWHISCFLQKKIESHQGQMPTLIARC